MTVNLGDDVRDKITGFRGIVIAREEYLFEGTTCKVQPQVLKPGEGEVPSWVQFPETRLDVIKESLGFNPVGFQPIPKGKP